MDEITIIFFLEVALGLMLIMFSIEIYLSKKAKKKMDTYIRNLNAKDEDISNVLKSLRKLHESVEEVNKLKKEVNEIKVSRK